jgi:peptidyl-prolyl cis-trans isomerase D
MGSIGMIQQMRDNAATIMWIVIIAFVATIVFAWGMDLTGRTRTRNVVGKVNGKEIPINYFEKKVEQERQQERERSGGADIPPYQNRMIPNQVLETEVSRILLAEAFEKMQLGASSEELFQYIKRNPPQEVYRIPQFQTDSVFDTSKYIQFLNDPRAYENEGMRMLEQYTREMLIPMQTLRILLSFQGFPSQAEVAYQYRAETEKAVFEYAKLNPSSLPFDSAELPGTLVERYYTEHPDSFYSEEQADLYFVKVPKIATVNDEKLIYNELLEVRKKINTNDSLFKEEAKIESDDEGSAGRGGDLGWISKGTMVPQFDSAAFTAPLNEVSLPIRTQFGFHLLFVEKREKKDNKVQAKVLHLLRKISPSSETMDRLNAQADTLHKLISADGIKALVNKQVGVSVDSTGLFKRGDQMPKVGYVSGASSFAFNHEVDDISDIFENEDGYYIFQIKRKLKKGLQPLAVVRDKIVGTLTDSLRLQKAEKRFEDDLKKMADKTDIVSLSKIDPLITTGKTDTVLRAQFIPQVGYNNQAAAAAFALKDGKISGVIRTKEALFVVKPLWHRLLETIPWTGNEIAGLRQKMESEAGQKMYVDWYLGLKTRAKIVDNVNQFYMD